MKSYGVLAQRYAKAIYEASSKTSFDAVIEEIKQFGQTVSSHKELEFVLSSQRFGPKERADLARDVCQKMQFSDLATQFVTLVSERGRVTLLESLIQKAKEIAAAQKGIQTVQIESATSLSSQSQETLLKYFDLSSSEQVDCQVTQDPSLLGGVKVKLGSQEFHGHLEARIKKLKTQVLGGV